MERGKIMETMIERGLRNTYTGNWLIDYEEIEKAGIGFDEFCDRLDNDYRVCEYELIDGGIDILFWLKYCENAKDNEKDNEEC